VESYHQQGRPATWNWGRGPCIRGSRECMVHSNAGKGDGRSNLLPHQQRQVFTIPASLAIPATTSSESYLAWCLCGSSSTMAAASPGSPTFG